MRCIRTDKMVPVLSARHPSGLTLMELMVSMVATSVLLAGMSSAIFLASSAAETGSAASGTIDASLTARQIATELGTAVSIVNRSATSIEFTVADRDDDGLPETIRYAWAGVLGGPLTRQYNQGTVVEVLDNVTIFGLAYHTKSIPVDPGDPMEQESAEQLLASFDTAGIANVEDVRFAFWPAQLFAPSLSADVVHWRVTRVELVLAKEMASQSLHVQLRPVTAGRVPASTFLEEVVVGSDRLPDVYAWRTFVFNNVSRLHPDESLSLVLTADNTDFPARVQAIGTGLPTSGLSMLTSNDQGANWTASPTTNLQFRVWGTVTTLVAATATPKTYLSRVDLALLAGSDRKSVVHTAIHLHNAPGVTVP